MACGVRLMRRPVAEARPCPAGRFSG
jgi:hypothetical protein